jgi:hypothetical protein
MPIFLDSYAVGGNDEPPPLIPEGTPLSGVAAAGDAMTDEQFEAYLQTLQ